METNWLDASEVDSYNPRHYDFRWNEDFSQFIPVKLVWWDDASYIRYQSDDFSNDDEFDSLPNSVDSCASKRLYCDDGMLF